MIYPQDAYIPLYENRDKFIILATGGRGSAKSFNISTFIERLSYEDGHKILYCRYTMSSAALSIIPEFIEKIELDGALGVFDVTQKDIVNKISGSAVMFRGIKTSSGNQTANLKSIQGLTTFVCDEGEEWVSEDDFEKLVLSIRKKGIQNRVIIVMNPSDVNHFIYRKYIKNTHKLIDVDGVQVQISTHPNVLHIHTTYLDNIEHLSRQFLNEIAEIKQANEKKYAHVVIGKWADVVEGAVFKKWVVVESIPDYVTKRGLGLDFGFTNDPTAIIECATNDTDLYLNEICYKTHMSTSAIIAELNKFDLKVMAESADPRLVQDIANAGINIYPVNKGSVKGISSILAGLDKMQEYTIHVTKNSYNILHEFRNYCWDKDKNGQFINVPIDKFNHAIDAVRYWVLCEILGRISGFSNIPAVNSVNDDELAGHAVFVLPNFDNSFISVSAFRFGNKVLIKDVIYNKNGDANREALLSMLDEKTLILFEAAKEWFPFANKIRLEKQYYSNMRVNKLNFDDTNSIASFSGVIKEKAVFLNSGNNEYNLFKGEVINYQDGQPSGPAYAVSRVISLYEF
jgi:phage terminase large subunit